MESLSPPIKSGTLDEVDANAIQQLVEADPREITDAELDLVVKYATANRLAWQKEENNPSGPGGGKKKVKVTADLDALDIVI